MRKRFGTMLKNEKYKGDTMLQKTFTEDFMTGKKSKNNGQQNKYYVKDSHAAIVSAEVYDKVQEEMAKRARLVISEDGTVEIGGSKYNGKYLLGNCLCAAIAAHNTGGGRREARWSGDALQGSKMAKMPAPAPLIWMKVGFRTL